MSNQNILYVTHPTLDRLFNEPWMKKVEHTLRLLRDMFGPHLIWQANVEELSPDAGERGKAYLSLARSHTTQPVQEHHIRNAVVFYGDEGPLAEACRKKGIPVYIQEKRVDFPFGEIGVPFPLTLNVAEGKLYYYTFSRNGLFSLCLSSGEMRFVGSVPYDPGLEKARLYHHAQCYGDWLYLCPFMGEAVARYHLRQNRWETFPLALRDELKVPDRGLFYNLLVDGEKVLLLPFSYGALVELDLRTGETRHCLNLWELFADESPGVPWQQSGPRLRRVFFHQYALLAGDGVVMPSLHSNVLLEYHLDSGAYRIHRLGNANTRLCAVTCQGDFVYVLSMNEPCLYRLHLPTETVATYHPFPEGFGKSCPQNKDWLWGRNECLRLGNEWYLFPARGNMVCRVELDTVTAERLCVFDDFCLPPAEDDISFFDGACVDGAKIYVWHKRGILLCYDTVNQQLTTIEGLLSFPPAVHVALGKDYCRRLLADMEE